MTITALNQSGSVQMNELSGEELFVLSIFASGEQRYEIEDELEKRAVNHEIRAMLGLNAQVTDAISA